MVNYAVGDMVVMQHFKAMQPQLRGATVKIIEISPMSVEANGKVFAISANTIAHYIPSVGDAIRTYQRDAILVVTNVALASCIVKDPVSHSDVTILCKDITRIVKRAEHPQKSFLYKTGDVVEPIDIEKYTNVSRLISAVHAKSGIKFKGSAKFVSPEDFRLSQRSVPKGLISIIDNGYTYLLYDGDNFSKYLKDTYFITCHILHNMFNEPVEVDYVAKGLGAEIIYSNHGTKLDGGVNSALKYINSVITR